jgi:hypothetical protein
MSLQYSAILAFTVSLAVPALLVNRSDDGRRDVATITVIQNPRRLSPGWITVNITLLPTAIPLLAVCQSLSDFLTNFFRLTSAGSSL